MENIPKIIHYCWFGRNPKPELILKCIDSWKKYMPDYKIIEWNEENYDVHKAPYISEAYECRKWAFVSDYARFDVINQYGGIYFDTDVELLKTIPDEVLSHEAFTGFEYFGSVNPGLVYGASAGSMITKEILDKYHSLHFVQNGKMVLTTVNSVITEILVPYGLALNNKFQIVHGLAIYPSEYFCGYDMLVSEVLITDKTISVHHYAGTWTKKTLKRHVQDIIKKLLGVETYRKLLLAKRRLRNKRSQTR